MVDKHYIWGLISICTLAIILTSLVLILVIPNQAQAAIVPCGRQEQVGTVNEKCTSCHFFVLTKNILDFILKDLTPVLATIFVITSGAMILFSPANPAMVARGIKLLTTTGTGVGLILGSWLIVNTLISQVSQYIGFNPGPDQIVEKWWKFPIYCGGSVATAELTCTPKTQTRYLEDSSQTEAEIIVNAQGGKEGEYNWIVKKSDGTQVPSQRMGDQLKINLTEGQYSAEVKRGQDPKTAVCRAEVQKAQICGTCKGVTCPDSKLPICEQIEDSCYEDSVNKLFQDYNLTVPSISGLNQSDGTKFIKALIARLSAGNPLVEKDNRFGLFQFTVAQANALKSSAGISDLINQDWLTNPDNSRKIINLAVAWINNQGLSSRCGLGEDNVRNLAAGFLGGESACSQSNVCVDNLSNPCSICPDRSGPTKVWECLWSDAGHNLCTAGSSPNGSFAGHSFTQIRSFAPRVEFCYQKF